MNDSKEDEEEAPPPAAEFLLVRHKKDILEIINAEDAKKHYSVNVNFVELFESDPELGNKVIKNPLQALCDLDNLLLHAQEVLIEEFPQNSSFKLNTHGRIYGLPMCPELHRTKFPRNADTDLFLQICGTVVRVTASKMLEFQRPYTCTKCKHIDMVEADYDFKYIITPPKKCINCGGTNLISIGELHPDNCKDYQEIKIQEKASEVGGTIPSALWVTLEDDLVDTCKPGDDVTICGLVKVRHGPLIVGKRIEAEIVLQANHILASNGYTSPKYVTHKAKKKFMLFWEKYRNRPIEGRDLILKSFCPKLYGMYIVKLATAIVLAGGSRCEKGNESGIQKRSEAHLLLVGDPGTGKSQLLRYAAKVVPRGILTTGVGTTSAGLTAAAMMEDGHWQLEGGALVLADGGVCCIDEFNSMKANDRTSIHEAMEQQTISIAKVGRVCKMQTRCSILAATNPKGGRLNPNQPLSLNLTLPSPLLSRFDIVMMLRDCYDEDWDNLIADHILNGDGDEDFVSDNILWNLETLQQYYIMIKDIHPVLTPTANEILGRYYQAQRRTESRNKARSTVRLLDSLIRLSQGHARFMCHSEVKVMDCLYAVVLIEASMDGECSILLDKVNVTGPFVADSTENYILIATTILQKLGLTQILNDEIATFEYNNVQHNVSNTEINPVVNEQIEFSAMNIDNTSKGRSNDFTNEDGHQLNYKNKKNVMDVDNRTTGCTNDIANEEKISQHNNKSGNIVKNGSNSTRDNNNEETKSQLNTKKSKKVDVSLFEVCKRTKPEDQITSSNISEIGYGTSVTNLSSLNSVEANQTHNSANTNTNDEMRTVEISNVCAIPNSFDYTNEYNTTSCSIFEDAQMDYDSIFDFD